MLVKDLIKLVENTRIDCVGDYFTEPYDKYLLDILESALYELDPNKTINGKELVEIANTSKEYITKPGDKLISGLERKCND